MEVTELCEIMKRHGADKATHHSYTPEYHKLLNLLRDAKRVLEIGVGTNELMKPIMGDGYKIGASLYGWMEYFPGATIVGLDIDEDVLFHHERIDCFYCDQSSKESLLDFIDIEYDVIIDDGSHVLSHQITSLEVLSLCLRPGGIYIIEDIPIGNIETILSLSTVENMEIVKVHYGAWSGDNFIALRK